MSEFKLGRGSTVIQTQPTFGDVSGAEEGGRHPSNRSVTPTKIGVHQSFSTAPNAAKRKAIRLPNPNNRQQLTTAPMPVKVFIERGQSFVETRSRANSVNGESWQPINGRASSTFSSQTYDRTIGDDQGSGEDLSGSFEEDLAPNSAQTNPAQANPVETNPVETNPVQRDPARLDTAPVTTPANPVNGPGNSAKPSLAPGQNIVPAAQITTAAQFARLPEEVQRETHQTLVRAGFKSGTPGITNPFDNGYWHGYSQSDLQAAHGLLASTVQRLTEEVYARQLQSNGNQMDGLSTLGGAIAEHTALNNFQLQMIEALNAIMNKVGHLIAEAAKGH